MAKPYPVELRERAVAAVLVEELPWEEAARRFAVGQATLARWLALWRAGQGLEPKQSRPGPAPILEEAARARLQAQLAANPDARLRDHARAWQEAQGQRVSETTLWRALRALNWTRKKSIS
jgi:transposase